MAIQIDAGTEGLDVRVAFRVDASLEIGIGHVVRCLALADALRELGVDCIFLSCSHVGNINSQVRLRQYEVFDLIRGAVKWPGHVRGDLAHSSWLKCPQEMDAQECLGIIKSKRCDVVVVDHYAIDYRWEEDVRQICKKIVVIDDLADRIHHCDMLLDQNWFEGDLRIRYRELVPKECELYLGPKYALLKDEYAILANIMPVRDGKIRRLLVFMGGSDPHDETTKVLGSLDIPELKEVLVDVILGVNHPDPLNVIRLAASRTNICVHQHQRTLAGWMLRADLMISGGGSTTWERMCLGLPSVVISIADNQTKTNRALHTFGYVEFLGESDQVTSSMIAGAIRHCISNPERIKNMSVKGMEMVDGRGAVSVSERIVELRGQ